MNDALKSQISAFVDGELPENETELLLRRLCQDDRLRTQVAVYMRVGRAIRGEPDLAGMTGLRKRVAAGLGEDMVATEIPVERAPGRFMRPIAGVAIAASVAVMALVGLRQLDPVEQEAITAFGDVQEAIAIEGAPSYTEPPAADFMSDRPSDRLAQYLVQHGLKSPNLGSRLASVEMRGDELETSDAADDAADGAEPEAASGRDESQQAQ